MTKPLASMLRTLPTEGTESVTLIVVPPLLIDVYINGRDRKPLVLDCCRTGAVSRCDGRTTSQYQSERMMQTLRAFLRKGARGMLIRLCARKRSKKMGVPQRLRKRLEVCLRVFETCKLRFAFQHAHSALPGADIGCKAVPWA
jgi:hypothetical protein